MEARRAETPLAVDKPMRGRTKGNWEAGDAALKRAPWTVAAASNLARAIEDPAGQTTWGQIAEEAVGIASVTAAFPQEAGLGAGLGAGLLVVAPAE